MRHLREGRDDDADDGPAPDPAGRRMGESGRRWKPASSSSRSVSGRQEVRSSPPRRESTPETGHRRRIDILPPPPPT